MHLLRTLAIIALDLTVKFLEISDIYIALVKITAVLGFCTALGKSTEKRQWRYHVIVRKVISVKNFLTATRCRVLVLPYQGRKHDSYCQTFSFSQNF